MGESGDRLTRAAKVLEQLTGGQTPVFSKGERAPHQLLIILLAATIFRCLLLFLCGASALATLNVFV